MLRYYDDAGLVKPEKIDEFTGYRYYSESQLPAMWKINTLNAVVYFIQRNSRSEDETGWNVQRNFA
jgi:DNA-binding transcriptional MerR regulator